MNIFVLDRDPETAAKMHCDKHANKMILECAQMLCATLHFYGEKSPYKKTHVNHPCSVWARASRQNCLWLIALMRYLTVEKSYRYPKKGVHLSWTTLQPYLSVLASLPFPKEERTEFVLCMPDKYKGEDPVEAYRKFYLVEKKHILVYTRREKPFWMKELDLAS